VKRQFGFSDRRVGPRLAEGSFVVESKHRYQGEKIAYWVAL
jgi:hypothetical protein